MNTNVKKRSFSKFSLPALLAALVAAPGCFPGGRADWPQWGGANQDFTADSKGLATTWPQDGPPKIWTRDLGEGYSAILVGGTSLYTMAHEGEEEIAICLDARTGQTIWEHRYPGQVHKDHTTQFGNGPRGTPLLSQGRLYTIGVSGRMHCLDAANGKPVWTQELWSDFEGTVLNHGYSSSPVAYKDTIIVMVGGEGHSLVALNKNDGTVAWKKQDFGNSYSTPKLISVDGQDQLVCYMATEIVGLDPADGKLLWQMPHANQWKQNITLPIWFEDENILFFTTSEAGSKAVKLTRNGDKTEVKELWSTRKVRLHHNNCIRVGDYVYGTTGSRVSFFMAINIKTGDIAYRKRGFAKANCIFADGMFIVLDEDGNLALITATPEEFTVHAKVPLLEKVSWTVPTLVGKTLYVRDKTKIMALDLG